MSITDEQLDQALAEYLTKREVDKDLLPSDFASALPDALQSAFLSEVEELSEIDRLAMSPPRDLPRRYGDFRILGTLGEGGMGTVYAAEDATTGKRVALKILHPAIAADSRMKARFEREAQTASSLDHPHVVPIHGMGEQEGLQYLVMGHVPGLSLARLLEARRDPRDLDHAAAIAFLGDTDRLLAAFACVADTLEFAHRRSVVHRDIKPANLMVRPDGAICILDFGLARSLESSGHALTQTEEFVGTPMYMSPEQARGGRESAPPGDVYSLGAVLYECLSGRPPFDPGPLPHILNQIQHRDPVPPKSLVESVPRSLSNIVVKAMEKDPGRRYRSAAELGDDLRRFLSGKPVRAKTIGLGSRVYRHWRRKPALYSTVAFALVAAVVGIVYGITQQGDRHELLEDNLRLAKDKELREITDALALAPEGIIVCAGLAIQWYANFGLGHHLPAGEAISAEAERAIAQAEKLLVAYPRDARVVRRMVRAYIDVGRLADARRVAQRLGTEPKDRALKALTLVFDNEFAAASAAFAELAAEVDADVQYFRGVYHMVTHRHASAAADFGAALALRDDTEPALSEEYRYYAHLMRGWCRSLPEISDYRGAQDDLRSAAALRPNYGTPQLLWAALRALDPAEEAAGEAVTEASAILTAVKAPWLTVLTARLLLGLAEPSADLPGPLSFNSDLSPLVSLPLEGSRWQSLVGVAKGLLEGLREASAGGGVVDVHYATALALERRFDAAIAVSRGLVGREGIRPVLPHLLEARVQIAAGRSGAAGRALDSAFVADPNHAHAWLCRADLARLRGDARDEARALERTAQLLASQSELLPHIGLLPHIQVRLARLEIARNRGPEALRVLASDSFGNALAGASGSRAVAERAVLRVQALHAMGASRVERLRALGDAERIVEAHPPRSPLRSLLSHLANERGRLGDPGAALRLRDLAADSLTKSWWKPLVFKQRGWLALDAEFESEALERAYAVAPHTRTFEALAAIKPQTPQRIADLIRREGSRTAPHFILATALARAGRLVDARAGIREFASAKDLDAGYDIRAAVRGLRLERGGSEVCEAIALLAQREGAGRGQSPATVLMATALLCLSRWREVVDLLEPALRDDPSNLKFAYLMAIARLQSGKPELARVVLRKRISAGELPDLERRLGFRLPETDELFGPPRTSDVRALFQ